MTTKYKIIIIIIITIIIIIIIIVVVIKLTHVRGVTGKVSNYCYWLTGVIKNCIIG